jgi:hypothetical protein
MCPRRSDTGTPGLFQKGFSAADRQHARPPSQPQISALMSGLLIVHLRRHTLTQQTHTFRPHPVKRSHGSDLLTRYPRRGYSQ